jgi:hypothetical protein
MKDHDVVLCALNKAALIVRDYLEPGHPRVATINRLIEVLDDQKLAAAIRSHQLTIATASDVVPELTCGGGIQLNEGVSLHFR